MTEADSRAARPRTYRWLRRLAFLAGGLVLLGVILYFVGTSSAFFKGIVLPRINRAMNAEITVGEASLRPFSRVVLKKVQVKTTSAEPLFVAEEIRARYHLWAILGGNVAVEEVVVTSPKVTLLTDADGKSNLDPLTQRSPTSRSEKAPTTPPSRPPQLQIQKVAIENGVIKVVQERKDGGQDLTELRNANLALTGLKNGQMGKLTFATEVSIEQKRPEPATNSSAQARVEGSFDLGLASDLNLASLRGNSRLVVSRAMGTLAEAAGLVARFDADITPTELKQVALRLEKEGSDLAEIRVSGPFDLAKREGQVKAELRRVDRGFLNLAGAGAGLDFGGTEIRSAHELTFAQGGKQITAKGELTAAKMSVTQKTLTTPVIDLRCQYDAEVNLDRNSGLIRLATVEAAHDQSPLLRGNLSSPMPITWGPSVGAAGDAAFNLVLTNLDLVDWRAFAPQFAATGKADGTLQVTSRQAGQQIGFNLAAQVAGLEAKFGSNDVRAVDVALRATGRATALARYQIDSAELRLTRQGQTALTLTGSGNCDPAKQDAELQMALEAAPARLLEVLPQPGLSLAAGEIRARAQVAQKGKEQHVTGRLDLASLSGVYQGKSFRGLAAGVDLDLAASPSQALMIRRGALSLVPTRLAPTNALQVEGRLDLSRPDAVEGSLKLTSETLDLTPYYDLLAGDAKESARPATGQPTPGTQGATNAEPAAVTLPIKLVTLEADLGRCYLRELAITNLQTTVRLEGNHCTVNPLQFGLNGAPVHGTLDLDLGQPGYRYAINLAGQGIPLEPLANTFSPDYRGRAKGEVRAAIALQGAGVTGPNLRKNLNGNIDVTLTNADIQIVGLRLKTFLAPIATAVRAPELLDTPLNWADLNVHAGAGVLDLRQVSLLSPLFTADTGGKTPIADWIGNSPLQKWPMNFALRRSLAERIKLAPKDTPTNAAYARLPQFISVVGTLDAPKAEINLRALAGSALELLGEKIPGADKKTGEILRGVGELLNRKPSTTNPPGSTATNRTDTNAPATTPAKPSLLDLLKPKK